MNPLFYLASPYSHSEPSTQERRHGLVQTWAGKLLNHGIHVFSPINHTVGLKTNLQSTDDWMPLDLNILSRCDGLIELRIEGWTKSKGMDLEVEFATRHKMPRYVFHPSNRSLRQLIHEIHRDFSDDDKNEIPGAHRNGDEPLDWTKDSSIPKTLQFVG